MHPRFSTNPATTRPRRGRRRFRLLAGFAAIWLVLGPVPRQVAAQEGASNETCLACHADASLWQTRPDGERFVVDAAALERSTHGSMRCVDCHRGMTFPHPDRPPEPTCGACHASEARQHAESLHGQALARGDTLAPTCSTCHGTHDVLPSSFPESPTNVMNVPRLCGSCHHEGTAVSQTHDIPQDRILENYSESIHGQGLYEQGLTVTAVCTSCHTSHFILPHDDPRSSIAKDNVARTCTQCHGRIEEVHVKVIEGKLWETEPHLIPPCVDCHQPHKIRRVFYDAGVANQDCFRCHSDPDLSGTDPITGELVSMFVDREAYGASSHAETGCAQCHTEVTPVYDERPCEEIQSPVDCSICHAEQVSQYDISQHGVLAAAGDEDAPTCQDCHQKHATTLQTDPTSPTFPRNVPELCARCHRQGQKAAVRVGSEVPIVRSYEMSIHGKGLLQSGLLVTATCTSCHGAHLELPPEDLRSRVNPDNLPDTCGSCHSGIEQQFQRSIHWPPGGDYTGATQDYPTCEDCHSAHTISRTDRDDFRLLMMSQCGRCHEEEAESFFDTYHGKVSRLGGAKAAKCYDCHGTHNILPPVDPRSTLSRANEVKTCSQCHPNANARFTGYLTHATHHDRHKYPWLFWSFWAMTGLLVGTLSFAMVHTGAWLWRLWRSPEEWRVHEAAVAAAKRKVYRRFTTFQRSLHLVMILSFMTLAATGMALKFSYMGWAQAFSRLTGGFEAMGVLHRIGAVALISIFVIHVVDVKKRKEREGKTWLQYITAPDSLVFNGNDLREFVGSVKWFFGRGERPEYGRYTYWEKFDYFAVFWGMLVIGSTGLFLWFPEIFTRILPGWLVNVATIIHSDEALLAVAFIFTIHFFNTHFRLDKFPMDPVIFTGRVPVDELKRDKPREYQRMLETGELEGRLVEPYPKNVETGFRVFGFTMLGVGLLIIALILYSVLFGYR